LITVFELIIVFQRGHHAKTFAAPKGIEQRVWIQIGERKTFAIADEDLERENEQKTASVHFLRFQLDSNTVGQLRQSASLRFGIDHAHYHEEIDVAAAQRLSLLQDFDE